MPSIALAASRRSSIVVDDKLLFLFLAFQLALLLESFWTVTTVLLTPVVGVNEYAAFAISIIDGFSFLAFASGGRGTANISDNANGRDAVLL